MKRIHVPVHANRKQYTEICVNAYVYQSFEIHLVICFERGEGRGAFYVVYSFFYALKTLVKMGNYLLLKTLDWKVWNLGLDKIIPVFPLTFLKTRVDRHFFFKCFKKFYLGIQDKNTCIRGESRHFNKGRAPGFVRK